MDAILLKKKEESKDPSEKFVIFDQLIGGLIDKEFFVPAFTGASQGLKIYPLTYLIDNFKFPKKGDDIQPKLLYFLWGAKESLFKTVEYYEDDTINIEPIPYP